MAGSDRETRAGGEAPEGGAGGEDGEGAGSAEVGERGAGAAGGESESEHARVSDRLSEYYEGQLAADEADRVRAHMAACGACQAAYHELEEAVGALSGVGRRPAPERFERSLEDTLRRRSAGRFFGRRALGDRIPFEILAVLALLLGLAIYGTLRASETGSLETPDDGAAEEPAP